jgi:hypothetical protein
MLQRLHVQSRTCYNALTCYIAKQQVRCKAVSPGVFRRSA